MSRYESYRDTTEAFSKCAELRDNVSLCLKGFSGAQDNVVVFLTKRASDSQEIHSVVDKDTHTLSRSNLRVRYLCPRWSRTKLLAVEPLTSLAGRLRVTGSGRVY